MQKIVKFKTELNRTLRKIDEIRRKGETRLLIYEDVSPETVTSLRDMGYLVLQIYIHGNIRTIVGIKDND